jgi:hypothetical protein
MVGRDLVVGATVGAAMTVVSYLSYFMPGLLQWPAGEVHAPGLELLAGARYLGATLFIRLSAAIENAMLGVLGLALLRVLLTRLSPRLGRTGVVFAVATGLFTPLAANGQFASGVLALDLLFGALLVALVLGALLHYGLFAGIVTFFTHFLTWNALATLDPSRQYFPIATAALALVAGLAVLAFVLARGQQPVFGRVIID